jgi:hypothetical protein
MSTPIPVAQAVPDDFDDTPTASPVDANGNSLIPELAGRQPTHNEQFLISGGTLAMASSNVKEFWWKWDSQRLFVRFLDDSLYAYEGVPLSVAVGFIETASPGRYVWNVLRDVYPAKRLAAGSGHRARSQVVRLVNRP